MPRRAMAILLADSIVERILAVTDIGITISGRKYKAYPHNKCFGEVRFANETQYECTIM